MFKRMLFCLLFLLPVALHAAEAERLPKAATRLNDPLGAGDVLQVFFALLFVLLLIGVAAWFFRRMSLGNFAGQGALRLLASVSVGQRERVVLVQAGETQLLLGVAQGNVRTLHVFDQPVLPQDNNTPNTENFAERLAAVLKRRGSEQQ
jgi:flagellar protein FliO/FliZ